MHADIGRLVCSYELREAGATRSFQKQERYSQASCQHLDSERLASAIKKGSTRAYCENHSSS